MGETAFARGDYAQAATLYEKATQKLDDPRILGALARCWLALGRSDDAMKVLIRMVEKYPDQLPAIRLLSGLYQQAQEPEKAIPLFTRYRSLGGQMDSPIELQLARIYRQAGHYEQAAQIYLRLTKDPNQSKAADLELAEMRSWQGQYEDSIDLFQKVLATDPSSRQARLGLARTLSWAGRYRESAEEYNRLLNEP